MQKIWLVIDSVIKHRTDGSFVRLISPVAIDEETTLMVLKEFVNKVLGPNDNIVHFEYSKKTNRESGPALVGIELQNQENLTPLILILKLVIHFQLLRFLQIETLFQ